MKMRSLFLITVLSIIFALTANAQVGIQAGYVNSVDKTKIGSTTTKSDPANGFNLGVTFDYNFNEYVGLQTGLLYSMTMRKDEVTLFGITTKTTATGHYVTLPINVKGNLPIGNSGLSIFAFVGPDFILGLAGTNKTKIGDNNEVSTGWYDDDSHLKRFDIALGMGGGIQYNNIRVKFGYDLGLLNLTDVDDVTATRNHFNVSLGFLF